MSGGCEANIKVRDPTANNTLAGHQMFVSSKLHCTHLTGKKVVFKLSACDLNMRPFSLHPPHIHSYE